MLQALFFLIALAMGIFGAVVVFAMDGYEPQRKHFAVIVILLILGGYFLGIGLAVVSFVGFLLGIMLCASMG